MLGEESYQLAQETKRLEVDHLVAYNTNQVSLVVRQTNQLWKAVEGLAKLVDAAQEAAESNGFDSFSLGSTSMKGSQSSQLFDDMSLTSSVTAGEKDNKKLKAVSKSGKSDSSQISYDTTVAQPENSDRLKTLMCQLILHHLTVYRNKRILLAYHSKRADALRRIGWELNLNTYLLSSMNSNNRAENQPASKLNADSHASTKNTQSLEKTLLSTVPISSFERVFIQEYTSISKKFRDNVENSILPGIDLDWTADLLKPPRDLFIEVRVVRECGEIQTETGVVNLEQGSQHYLRRTDVENLIKLGYLQHIG